MLAAVRENYAEPETVALRDVDRPTVCESARRHGHATPQWIVVSDFDVCGVTTYARSAVRLCVVSPSAVKSPIKPARC